MVARVVPNQLIESFEFMGSGTDISKILSGSQNLRDIRFDEYAEIYDTYVELATANGLAV